MSERGGNELDGGEVKPVNFKVTMKKVNKLESQPELPKRTGLTHVLKRIERKKLGLISKDVTPRDHRKNHSLVPIDRA